MNYYQEISLLPNADIGLNFLWQKVYQQIHLALVESKRAENESVVGVAFPEYDADEYSLGTKLRLFAGDDQALEQMQCEKWLSRLSDYVHLSRIKPVPEKVAGHACFKHMKGGLKIEVQHHREVKCCHGKALRTSKFYRTRIYPIES